MGGRFARYPAIGLILCVLSLPGLLRAAGLYSLQASGFVKSTDLYLSAAPLGTYRAGIVSANQFRGDLSGEAGSHLSFELSAENRLTGSRVALSSLDGYGNLPARGLDLEADLHDGRHLRDTLYLDRLNVTLRSGATQVTLGRQAIGFGRISLISPLDVICPFSPEEVDTEVRPGVDAVRGVHYFGLGGQVGATAVFGEKEENNAYLATFSYNFKGADILAMAGTLQDRSMAGAGVALDVGGVGLKGEISVYQGKRTADSDGDLQSVFAVGAVEAWYRFANGLILCGEYLYNGAGADDPDDYARVEASAFTAEGLNYLAGRHYMILAPAYDLTALVTLEMLVVANIADSSMLLRPLLELSLFENMDMELYWTFKTGRKPVFDSLFGIVSEVPQSEFGASGDYGGLCLKCYF